MQALRELALSYPEARESVACEGTALECSTFKARNKTFFFWLVDAGQARVKLQESLPEAERLSAKDPFRYLPGAHGWVRVTWPDPSSPPLEVLSRWIDESYRLLAPKQLVALLPARAPARSNAATRKKTSRKKGRLKTSGVKKRAR
jgi:hypothetical protein